MILCPAKRHITKPDEHIICSSGCFLERNDMNGIPGERAVIPYGSGSSGQQCFPGLTGTCMEE